jgi:pyruvate/2-oxoglutarate/acetoin dehydrogenase E1 component
VRSIKKTGKLLVVDNGWVTAGASAEIIAQVSEKINSERLIKIERLGFAQTSCPTTKPLETIFYPNSQTIASKAFEMITGENSWTPSFFEAKEISEFKGPF